MKSIKLFLISGFAVLIPMTSFSQVTATYDEVSSKKVKGQLTTYITQKGEAFSIGDTITLGTAMSNEQFDLIEQNSGLSFEPLSNVASHSQVVIKKIKALSKIVYVRTTKPQGGTFGLMITNFEAAVINGEVQSKIMSSDQALEELIKWKSKLDLGLITQEEYEAKKKELAKLIN